MLLTRRSQITVNACVRTYVKQVKDYCASNGSSISPFKYLKWYQKRLNAFLQQLFAVITRKEVGDVREDRTLGAGLCAVQLASSRAGPQIRELSTSPSSSHISVLCKWAVLFFPRRDFFFFFKLNYTTSYKMLVTDPLPTLCPVMPDKTLGSLLTITGKLTLSFDSLTET